MEEYKRCTRCVMDNKSDETITFDKHGRCNYCTDALNLIGKVYFPNAEGEQKLRQMIEMLKYEGKGKQYDCLMGISGGLDSAYLAYLGSVKWGLRILAVHVDDGYDTELATSNIKNLCEACGIELMVEAPDSEQFNAMTKAFIKAEVPNIAIPQDNILFACLYNYARKYKVYNFLSGGNFALECVLQKGNTYEVFDMIHNRDIQKKFGSKPIDKLSFLSSYQKIVDTYLYKIKSLRPLNYIDYNKECAIHELNDFCGFTYYEAKHLENILTKVTQLYWFYHKFHVDKRTSHLSSLIVSGQMSREQALAELEKPVYDKKKKKKDIEFVLKKIEMSREEFEELINRPGKQHSDYRMDKFLPFLHKIKTFFD